MKNEDMLSPFKPEWKAPQLKKVSIKEITRGPIMAGNNDGVSGMSMAMS
jgi:hypothetical protein